MSEQRIRVDFVAEKDSRIDAWHLAPRNCPVAEHLKALGLNLWKCRAGIVTNAQGPVPLKSCKHFAGDNSLKAEGKCLSIGCNLPEERDDD